eukprot:s322_g21.t1
MGGSHFALAGLSGCGAIGLGGGASNLGSKFINDQIPIHQREVAKIQTQMNGRAMNGFCTPATRTPARAACMRRGAWWVKACARHMAAPSSGAEPTAATARLGGKRSKKKALAQAANGYAAESSGRRGPSGQALGALGDGDTKQEPG